MARIETTGLLYPQAHCPSGLSGGPSFASRIILAILLTSFIAATYGFGIYLFAQLVTDMRADLNFGFSTVGIITATAQAGFLAFAMLGVWLSPRIGGSQVVVGSVALCGLCLILLPSTDNILMIGILLVIMSGTAASVWVPMAEIVARAFAYWHRGKILGLASSGTSYGVFINSLLVPGFVAADNWRGVWFSVGFGTLAVTLSAFLTFWRLGLFRRELEPLPAQDGGISSSWLNASAGKSRGGIPAWILVIWAITFLNGLSTLPFQNYLAPYLREELGFHVVFASQVWALIGFIGMFAGFFVGWLSDKSGVRVALLFCYIAVLLSSILLTFWPHGVIPLLSGVFFALAFYPIFGLVPAYIAKMASNKQGTAVFGVANVTLGIGGVCGNYLGGALKEATGSFALLYFGVAAVCSILIVLSIWLPPETTGVGPPET